MMTPNSTGFQTLCFLTLLCCGILSGQVLRFYIANGIIGEAVRIPCNRTIPDNLIFVKWKYERPDGVPVSLATKSVSKETPQFDDVPEYVKRLNVSEDFSLIISNAGIREHDRRFVCMVTTTEDVLEAPALVKLFKLPSEPEIINKAQFLEVGNKQKLGDCIARESFPEGNVTWYRKGTILRPGDGDVEINLRIEKNPTSSFYTTTSELHYKAKKEDVHSDFSCQVTFFVPSGQNSSLSRKEYFDVHYPTEKVTIEVVPPVGFVNEGDHFTIKCTGDGNPPPQEFEFHTPLESEKVVSYNYTVVSAKRNATGDYSCALNHDKEKKASLSVEVNYLDMSLTPNGEVNRMAGENLSVLCNSSSNKPVSLTWKKDNKKIDPPIFKKLHYRDSGSYVCEVGYKGGEGTRLRKTLILTVEGKPQVKVTKKISGGMKKINCSVEGFPKPDVFWILASSPYSGNSTEEEPYVNQRFTSSIKIEPKENVTVTCVAVNKLGRADDMVNVSAVNIPDEESETRDDDIVTVHDQAKLIIAVVVGLLAAAIVAGVAYWIYMRTKKTSKSVEKNLGNCEESRKLEENNHTSQA
ncbi:CD166 antigen [Protopterus annectens]|uniref:CD166 antigen n=1 Tax=Protopterus annectens TaxID=7888 RepID=UPI001CF9C138|nr:CD166 antigen [Protopterus annectens]